MFDKQHPEINRFLDITQQLTALMEQEMDYLRSDQQAELAASHQRKEKLTSQYAIQMNLLRNRPEIMKSLSDVQRDKVKDATESLNQASEQNARMLKAAYDTSEKIMHIMLQVAKQHNRDAETYNVSGTMANSYTPVYGHAPTPLTMDQRF